MDFEEKVRSSAVACLCEAATKNMQVPILHAMFPPCMASLAGM